MPVMCSHTQRRVSIFVLGVCVGIGGILRWQIDFALLNDYVEQTGEGDEDEGSDDDDSDDSSDDEGGFGF